MHRTRKEFTGSVYLPRTLCSRMLLVRWRKKVKAICSVKFSQSHSTSLNWTSNSVSLWRESSMGLLRPWPQRILKDNRILTLIEKRWPQAMSSLTKASTKWIVSLQRSRKQPIQLLSSKSMNLPPASSSLSNFHLLKRITLSGNLYKFLWLLRSLCGK